MYENACRNYSGRRPVTRVSTERIPSKQPVGGSNPSGRVKPCVASVADDLPPSESAEKANGHPLADAAEAFLLTKHIAGCTAATLRICRWCLRRLQAEVPIVTPLTPRFDSGTVQEQPAHRLRPIAMILSPGAFGGFSRARRRSRCSASDVCPSPMRSASLAR